MDKTSIRILLVGLVAWLVACASPPTQEAGGTPAAWQLGRTRDGATDVAWQVRDGELRSNRMVEVEVELTDAAGGAPVEGATVSLAAFMPDHGHGTNLVPRTTELGGGRYLVEGVLLHMGGYWELRIDVVREGVASRVTFDLEL